MNESVPHYRLYECASLSMHFVIENVATGVLRIVTHHCPGSGIDQCGVFRGHRASLKPVPGYVYMGTNIPLRRPWREVCQDTSGDN